MGGVVDAIATMAKPWVDKAVTEFEERSGPAIAKDASEKANKLFKSIQTPFKETKAGQQMLGDISEYHKVKGEAIVALDKQFNNLPKKALGPTMDSNTLRAKASNIARERTFGKYDALIAANVKAAANEVRLKTGDEGLGKVHAQRLADHLAMMLHDTEDEYKVTRQTKKGQVVKRASEAEIEALRTKGYDPKKTKIETTQVSRVKYNIARNLEASTEIDTSPVWHPSGKTEHFIMNYLSRTLASAIAIPHLATVGNVAFGTPMGAAVRSMKSMLDGSDGVKNFVLSSGAISEDVLRGLHDAEGFKNGHITRLDPDSIGARIAPFINAPGFKGLRKWTTVIAGVTADHSAAEYATRFAEQGDRASELQLREVYKMDESDLVEIKRNNGQLSSDQRNRAVYHGINDKIFLNPEMNRSYYSGSNAVMRMGGMFHGYLASQGKLMGRELSRAARSKSPAYAANVLLTMGVMFPFMGLAVKTLEKVGRGDWDNIHPGTDLETLIGMNGFTPAMEEWFDDFGHVGAFGVLGSLTQGLSHNALANSIVGPIANMAIADVQDAHTAATKGNFVPIAKDALQQTPGLNIDNIGKIISHMLFPHKPKPASDLSDDEKEERAEQRRENKEYASE